MGPCCVSGHLHSGEPRGHVVKLAGLDAYVTGDPINKPKTILFLTEIFGYHLPNARLLADEHAAAGFYVVVPDFYEGDYAPVSFLYDIAALPGDPEPAKDAFDFPVWKARHMPERLQPMLLKAVEAITNDPDFGLTGKLFTVGFCYGAKQEWMLAGPGSKVTASVANHPSNFTYPDDIEAITVPTLILVGDDDVLMPLPQVLEAKTILEKKNLGTVHVYPGEKHSFAIRGDLRDENIKKDKEDAARRTVEWFKGYL